MHGSDLCQLALQVIPCPRKLIQVFHCFPGAVLGRVMDMTCSARLPHQPGRHLGQRHYQPGNIDPDFAV